MYKCSKIAEDMIWHHKCRIKDDILEHPPNGKAWKDFDEKNPTFVEDPRNIIGAYK